MPEVYTFSDGRPMDAITHAAIAEAVAKERERCVKIVEMAKMPDRAYLMPAEIAEAIRNGVVPEDH